MRAVSLQADINVIDIYVPRLHTPHIAHYRPSVAGASCSARNAIRKTIKSGPVIYENGDV